MSIKLDTNPLRKGLQTERIVDPCVFVIFGATGDLAHRKLLPALFYLYLDGLLPRGFAIIGFASSELTDDEFRQSAKLSIAKAVTHVNLEGRLWHDFAEMLHYVHRTDDTSKSMQMLKSRIDDLDSSIGLGGNCLFYLSIPPFVFGDSAIAIRDAGLQKDEKGNGWRRIVVEKPFGSDLESARELNKILQSIFDEKQIYRIDHYLGKETVQNILVFRFVNQFVEPLLNAKFVDNIQITVAETIGVEKRGGYYDNAGALRDIVQNHMLQLLSLICMEPPRSLDPEDVRDEKIKLLRSIRPIYMARVNEVALRGQYHAGILMGERVPGYREEEHVRPDSQTETFVALKLKIDNWRWDGITAYLRTGKRLAKRGSEIAIQLKCAPRIFFGEEHRDEVEPNLIVINIQPDEGISIRFDAKVPGLSYHIQPVKMDFKYGSAFGASAPEAYERLLLDAMLGDPSLFARSDATEAAWMICDPIIQGWHALNSPLYFYAPGSWGPKEAMEFIARDGRSWRRL